MFNCFPRREALAGNWNGHGLVPALEREAGIAGRGLTRGATMPPSLSMMNSILAIVMWSPQHEIIIIKVTVFSPFVISAEF